jgi:hypothetical protein
VKALKVIGWVVLGLIVVLAVVTAVVLAVGRERSLEVVFGPIEQPEIDFATLVRKPTPNQYLMCPPGACAAETEAESPVFDLPARELEALWLAMVVRQPRTVQTAHYQGLRQYDFVQRSELMRYPDTITVRFIPLDDGRATLAIYSRAHYGRKDFGVNRARIEAWLAELAKEVP